MISKEGMNILSTFSARFHVRSTTVSVEENAAITTAN